VIFTDYHPIAAIHYTQLDNRGQTGGSTQIVLRGQHDLEENWIDKINTCGLEKDPADTEGDTDCSAGVGPGNRSRLYGAHAGTRGREHDRSECARFFHRPVSERRPVQLVGL